MTNITELIKSKKAKVAVMGLGYVGLPHALLMARAGFEVLGLDVKKSRVDDLNKGKSYIGDVKDEELAEIINLGKFKAFNNFEPLKDADIIMICVPTPLDKNKNPDVSYIKKSAEEIKKYLHKGQLVILESTTYPGTTEELVLPMLEESGLHVGKDFHLVFAPERIDPGNDMAKSKIAKVVGGVTKECTEIAVLFYSQFLEIVYPVSSAKTAEMTKILENTFRLVNISMINELALLCGKMRIDIWEVIEAAKTKPYGFMPFYPSPKAGGHCIPLDPFYLSYKAREFNFWAKFIELAGEINEQMPHFIVTKINYWLNLNKKSINSSKILIWGAAYKKDIADSRESGFYDIAKILIKKGAEVDFFDPFVKEVIVGDNILKEKILKSIDYSLEVLNKYDVVVILTDHSGFDYEEIGKNSKLVVDTRNAIKNRSLKNIIW
ncbi:MAG: nucleotide sugar dehydrogenase [Candidatus Staskawiczbacteria bacterium]|jgi:UDP-N-acetyl-D-glucosamine dehydrogenase